MVEKNRHPSKVTLTLPHLINVNQRLIWKLKAGKDKRRHTRFVPTVLHEIADYVVEFIVIGLP